MATLVKLLEQLTQTSKTLKKTVKDSKLEFWKCQNFSFPFV